MGDDVTTGRDADPRTPWIPVYVVIAAFVLARFGGPLGRWIGSVGTAAHEIGHAAFADVLAGRVISITVFRDGGGVTFREGAGSDWRDFLVSGAGYPTTLFAALALLTGVLFARSSRAVTIGAGVVCWFSLLFWTPFSSAVPGVDDGDQRFTWFLLLVVGALLVGVSWLPDLYRRIVLGALSVGLLTDAFRAGKDLTIIEGGGLDTSTDADSMAAVAVGGPSFWAWAMRLSLFLVAAAWAWWALRRWTADMDRRLPT